MSGHPNSGTAPDVQDRDTNQAATWQKCRGAGGEGIQPRSQHLGTPASAAQLPPESLIVDMVYAMPRVVVNVMPKPEILDPQGKAVTGALKRLGFDGMTVRQGKRFEVEVDEEVTPEVLARISEAAEKLLANTVIEAYEVVAG
ncbi:hypothetical protein SK1NUM_05940 [Arachnia rubra]|nr:hypothetical protein SK1NUM_05940 [Arachnia rubra]